MRHSAVLLGSLVLTACTAGSIETGPEAPESVFPLAPHTAESQLPEELAHVAEESAPAAATAPEQVDPVRAARAVRHVVAEGRTIELDDEITNDDMPRAPEAAAGGEAPAGEAPAGDLTLPGGRGLDLAAARVARGSSDIGSSSHAVLFGADNRQLVGNTLDWPARAIVKIFVTWPNGANGGCSGTLIGRKSVITAGHCIYNPEKGGWAARTRVVPGLDGKYMPFGSADQVYFDTVKGWTEDQNNDYDYALITLDRNLGDATGWFGIASLSDDTLDGLGAAIQGYPGDLSNGSRQYVDTDPVQDYDSTMIYYDIDTMPGDSGASLRPTGQYAGYVIGVHGGDGLFWLEHYNRSARINSDRFYKIQGWINNHAGLGTAGGDFSGWGSVGGKIYTDPTTVASGNGRFDSFVRGTDGAVYHKYRTSGGTWSPSATGWSNLGGSITGSVAAVSRTPGQIDVFVRGGDGAVYTKALNGSTWWPAGGGWARLGGNITGDPVAVSYGASRLDVFARGVNGDVVWFKWAGTTWSDAISLGGSITDHPSVASWGTNRLDLFARASGSGNLVHRWYNGTSWNNGWENLGGYIDTAPTAVAPKASVLEVFARGGDQAVWHRRYEAGWKDWSSLGGAITDEISVAVRVSNQIDLFVRGQDGAVYTKAAGGGGAWWPGQTSWAWLGGDMLGTPSVVSTAGARLDVIARGSDNGVRLRSWTGASW